MKPTSLKKSATVAILCVALTIMPNQKTHAVVWVVVKAALIKVIKAIDLQVQRLQNKTIWLQNAQKSLENTMSKLQLDEITDWVEKHREQYAEYFEELKTVKEAIDTYQQVKSIMNKQLMMIHEYRKAFAQFRNSAKFTPGELEYMAQVYTGIINASANNLDELFLVIRSRNTQMTDGSRLAIINAVAGHIDENLNDLRTFNEENVKLSLSRTRSISEMQALKQLFGVE
jgi:hypothetical protein